MAKYLRNYRLLLYPDNEIHVLAQTCLEVSGVDFVCVLHDADVKEDGEPVKPHWHYVVTFKDAKTPSAANTWFKKMGIESRFVWPIETPKERKKALRYLLHLDDPDKAQYPLDSAKGPLASVLTALAVNREDENARVLAVLDLVKSYNRQEISYTSFVRKACEADLWGTLRHMGQWGVKIIDEHNSSLYDWRSHGLD